MTNVLNPSASRALEILNYGSPILLITYHMSTSVFATCTLVGDKRRHLSKSRRTWMIGLVCLTTTCYFAQSLSLAPNISATPDDRLVHTIAQTLLWTAFLLAGLDATSPIPSLSIVVVNCILEAIICGLTFAGYSRLPVNSLHACEITQLVTLMTLALLAAVDVLFTFGPMTGGSSERQSLLSPRQEPATTSTSSPTRGSIMSGENADSDLAGSNNGDLDAEFDDDQKEIKLILKQRLKATGGWLGYLKSFNIFLPYVYPKESIRLQIYIAVMILSTVVVRALIVLQPRQLGIIVDKLAEERRVPWADMFIWIAIGVASSDFCGLGTLVDLLKNRMTVWSRQKLTIAALDHVMELSMRFHDEKDSGEIIKAIEQAGSISFVLEKVVLELVPAMLDILVAACFVTYLFDIYAFLIAAAVGIMFCFVTYHATILNTAARRASTYRDRLQSKVIYESVSNWFTVMCMNQKPHTMERLSGVVEDAAVAHLWNEDLYNYMFVGQELSEQIGRLGITILAARRVAAGISSIGDLVTLESYWATLMMPFYALAHGFRNLNSNLVDTERLLQLFKQQVTVKDEPGARALPVTIAGKVAFNAVGFSYPGRGVALHNFSMTAQPGQMIALVGETGSGKSTTLKLLMRFYDVTSGSITIDDHDIRNLTLSSLRSSFGFVPQDTVLFNTSILENVRYGDPSAPDTAVHEACRAAAIHDKILTYPSGYHSRVGERGVKMSGGERQRIAIARVFLKNPQIVLLDEATSAMDSQTESRIQGALRRLMQGRTTFVVAHRLSTVVDADRILVVDQGKVVESGGHEELLAQRGTYHELWTKQAAIL